MNDQTIEQEIQAKGLTAPRITPEDIEANITSTFYFTAAQGLRRPHATTVAMPLDHRLKDWRSAS